MKKEELNRQILKYYSFLLIAHLSLFVTILGFSIYHVNSVKKSVAKATLETIYNSFITGDIRTVVKVLDPISINYFSKIKYKKGNMTIEFPMKKGTKEIFWPQYTNNAKFDFHYDELKTSNAGHLTFYYNLFAYLPHVVLLWFLTLLAAIPFFFKLKNRILREHKRDVEVKRTLAVSKIASQVSHDIRSPLASLKVVLDDLDSLPETTRTILRMSINRIQDIANNLLLKNRNEKNDSKPAVTLISICLEEIVTEKRLEYRSNLGISITGDYSDSYGLFAKIDRTGLKTIISNCINNSIEAFENNRGKIKISLKVKEDFIKVTVKDNGNGIPKKIIDKIGTEGFSHGKEKSKKSGSGIGIYNAIKAVKSWGGDLWFESEDGYGTTVSIMLPKHNHPKWFLPKVSLTSKMAVVVLDDDEGIHNLWSKRFSSLRFDNNSITELHFSTPEEIESWVNTRASKYDKVVYLCDLELIGHDKSGLDIIENLKLKDAVLVTSHFAEKDVLERCDKLGVKMIPKPMAGDVPIEIASPSGLTAKYTHCHIDDDFYIRSDWKRSAKKCGISMLSASSRDELMENINDLGPETKIYIDSQLEEDDPPGEILAKELYDLGFKDLTMSTGYTKDKFKDMPWIKDVIGKGPLFV